MRKWGVFLLCCWMILGSFTACADSKSEEYAGFLKSDFAVVEEEDTHGGFHGDGMYYLILDCSGNHMASGISPEKRALRAYCVAVGRIAQ